MDSTYRVSTGRDIVQHVWVLVENRVDKADGALAGLQALSVDQTEQRGNCRSGTAGAEDLAEISVDDDAEPGSVGGDIGETFASGLSVSL